MTGVPHPIPSEWGCFVRRVSDAAVNPGWSWYAITLWFSGHAWMTTYAAATPPTLAIAAALFDHAPDSWIDLLEPPQPSQSHA